MSAATAAIGLTFANVGLHQVDFFRRHARAPGITPLRRSGGARRGIRARAGGTSGRSGRPRARAACAGARSGTSSTSPMRADGPVGHHHDAVGQQHRLVDVVGDHQHGVAELADGSPSPSPADARASARRARRTARRAAAPSAPSPARGRGRRAASCRRRFPPAACPWRAPSARDRDCASSSRGARRATWCRQNTLSTASRTLS